MTAFPLARRIGEIREVAETLFRKRSVKSADAFRAKVADRLFEELRLLGLTDDAQDEAVGAFFDAVELEMSSRRPHGCRCHAW